MKLLQIAIAAVAVGGILFSGYLTYFNLFGPGCDAAVISCSGGGAAVQIFGLPTCVYGLVMFSVIFLLALASIAKPTEERGYRALFAIAVFGFLFSGFLSLYELFIALPHPTSLPACVYGLAMYTVLVGLNIYLFRKRAQWARLTRDISHYAHNNAVFLMFAGIVFLLGSIIFVSGSPSIFSKLSTEESARIGALAQCLADKNTVVYGAYWCPHCQNQKKAFGEHWGKIRYVECSLPGGTGMTDECKSAGIKGYPTWVFADGSRIEGEAKFKDLAERAGCAYDDATQ